MLIDEAQDFHPGHWRFLRASVSQGPNDIFLAEDSHQRIYGQRLVLSHYGISTRGRASHKLRLNYRTTAQNLAYASAILKGAEWIDSTESTDDITGYRSVRLGPVPQVAYSQDEGEESQLLVATIRTWLEQNPNASIGVLARSKMRIRSVSTLLSEAGVAVNDSHSPVRASEMPVSVMTMQNAKGMEFSHVILLDIGERSLPQRSALRGLAPAEYEDALLRERALLYVAASRARDQLLVSVVGEPSPLLPEREEHADGKDPADTAEA